MNGALKAAWALTAFVVRPGAIAWAVTGRAGFALFIVVGVATGVAAAFALRSPPGTTSTTPEEKTP